MLDTEGLIANLCEAQPKDKLFQWYEIVPASKIVGTYPLNGTLCYKSASGLPEPLISAAHYSLISSHFSYLPYSQYFGVES